MIKWDILHIFYKICFKRHKILCLRLSHGCLLNFMIVRSHYKMDDQNIRNCSTVSTKAKIVFT